MSKIFKINGYLIPKQSIKYVNHYSYKNGDVDEFYIQICIGYGDYITPMVKTIDEYEKLLKEIIDFLVND